MDSIKIIGVQDELEVFEDKVVITPKGVLGFINKGFKGGKEIPFSSITAIQLKEASLFINGYIQFTIPGGSESKSGLLSAAKDENTFMFAHKYNEIVVNVKIFILERMSQSTNNSNSPLGVADEILKLKQLKDQGVITEEEFILMKQNIISKAA